MTASAVQTAAGALLDLSSTHPCYEHPLFERLCGRPLSKQQAAALLKNYDAHACVLRRLLLKAAAIMPEAAVGFVLENVRNEYGNGDYAKNHQLQLLDLADQCGIDADQFAACPVQPGVRKFISEATRYYAPSRQPGGLYKPAIAAGAITATEVLAIKEFRCLQTAFARFGLQHHIWFDHVTIEAEHSDESLALALYFVETRQAWPSVEHGMAGVLAANVHLYDGLLSAIENSQ